MKHTQIFSVVVLAGLLLTACSGTPTGAAPMTAANPPAPRIILVTGEGRAEGAPDIAVATLGVETRDPSVTKAVAENNQKATSITQAVLAQNVAAKDIQTTGFNVYFQDVYDPNGKSTGEGKYVVSNTITVTVRDLTKLGPILGSALDAGANSVSGVNFTVADPSKLLTEARGKALADAQARASEIAKGLNVEILRVLTASEGSLSGGATDYLKAAPAFSGMGGGSVPVQSGTYTVTMQMTVTFEIK
jgi:uncharacterized protein